MISIACFVVIYIEDDSEISVFKTMTDNEKWTFQVSRTILYYFWNYDEITKINFYIGSMAMIFTQFYERFFQKYSGSL